MIRQSGHASQAIINSHAHGSHFPWSDWFVFAVSVLRLSPHEFWQLSVVEWRWLLGTTQAISGESFNRDMLDALIEQYPDKPYG